MTVEARIHQLLQTPKGRKPAFNLIVDEYQKKLYWHIRRMVLSHEDADDVLQNTFIRIWKGLPSYRGEARIYTWLYRIATNEALSHLKTEKKRHLPIAEDHHHFFRLKTEHYFDAEAGERKFLAAVHGLPEKQKLVFQMKYFEDLKYEEISDILQTSVGALKASYHHAVQKIKAALQSD